MGKTWLVTGGAGFIGSNFVHKLRALGEKIVVLDALTYAGCRENLPEDSEQTTFVKGDICDAGLVAELLAEHQPHYLINFAAESHVDNSIHSSAEFIRTNIQGTHNLLEQARAYVGGSAPADFRYVQISTDEVFGSLEEGDPAFTEQHAIRPSSPYSSSKAAADMLVEAWGHTYGLPTVITHCSNNYGPRQHHEKLIPHMISCALAGKNLPVYGNGNNIRDWIFVEDHCQGIYLAATQGKLGQRYCFGGESERRNLDVVKAICSILDEHKPRADGEPYAKQVRFVEDRLGHDWRYAINNNFSNQELGFEPSCKFEEGLEATVKWYLNVKE